MDTGQCTAGMILINPRDDVELTELTGIPRITQIVVRKPVPVLRIAFEVLAESALRMDSMIGVILLRHSDIRAFVGNCL